MNLTEGKHRIGSPGSGLQVKVYREGIASKVGHDLVLDVARWRATVVVGPGEADWSIELSADPDSLEVREGIGGVKPLSDGDRDEILGNIEQKVLRAEPIEFRSTAVQAGSGRISIDGDLTIAGETRPIRAELDVGDGGRVSGTIGLDQSEWRIKPYSGLMGALKVRDRVEVVIDAQLPGG